MNLNIRVVNREQVLARLKSMPDRVRSELRSTISKLSIDLQRHVVADKLSGQALKVRTGRLRRSIGQKVTESGSKVTGEVGTNVEYAAAHEYGFRGIVQIKEHLRLQSQAFGRPMSPRQVVVSAHSARMNIPERSFLRSALSDMTDQIRNDIKASVERAVGS